MDTKDTDSIATVQMKPEYAASDVYSNASEAPPAYIRKSSSVQIAKIIAITVITSSFIIGSFILASTYLHAKASCDQLQTLDSLFEKELLLESMQQELPKAEPLLQEKETLIENQNLQGNEIEANKLDDDKNKKETSSDNPTTTDSIDSSFSENEDAEELNRINIKIPLDLDLSDLANALLENNQKSRMNCVVERRHAEELVPDQKQQRITGEKITIICESGSETNPMGMPKNMETEQIHPIIIPLNRFGSIPYGPLPQQFPLTHMPQQQQQPQVPTQSQMQQPAFLSRPQFMINQMLQQSAPFMRPNVSPSQYYHHQQQQQQQHQMPPVPDQIMQAPRPQLSEMRLQLQRIPMRSEMFNYIQQQQQEQQSQQQQQQPQHPSIQMREIPIPLEIFKNLINSEMEGDRSESSSASVGLPPQVQVQRIPLAVALQRAGITQDDLKNIQHMAEERIQDELRHLAIEDLVKENSDGSSSSSSSSSSDSSEEDEDDDGSSNQQKQQDNTSILPQQILQIGRTAYGRSLLNPVRIPVNMMMPSHDDDDAVADSERPHFVQPRSVRSVPENPFSAPSNNDKKRVKRCACDCNC